MTKSTSDNGATIIRFTPMERVVGGIIVAVFIGILGWIGNTAMETRDAVIRFSEREVARDAERQQIREDVQDHEARIRVLEQK